MTPPLKYIVNLRNNYHILARKYEFVKIKIPALFDRDEFIKGPDQYGHEEDGDGKAADYFQGDYIELKSQGKPKYLAHEINEQ